MPALKTVYAATLQRLGLSLAEAAVLHDVRLDTVKSWSSGRNPTPAGVWDELRAYEDRLQDLSGRPHEAQGGNADLMAAAIARLRA